MKAQERILVVDDDPINVELILEIFEDQYELLSAGSGEEAMEVAARSNPDLVLLDIMMPGIDGYEVCRRMRADPVLARTKILLLSAKALTEERLAGYEVGADDYITKPFDSDELVAKVKVFLRLKHVEEVDQLKSDLLGLLSHEIRTPLTGIFPAAEMLRNDDGMKEEERLMWVEMITHGCRRLMSFTVKGLLLCQFRADAMDLHTRPVELGELARSVAGKLDYLAESKQLTVEIDAQAPAHVEADPDHFGTMITCLHEIALESVAEGGSVRIVVESRDDQSRISFLLDGVCAEFGGEAGLFDALQAKKVEGETVGADLNLALASRIARAHGGDLTVETEAEQTARFCASIPITCSAPDASVPTR